MSSTEKVAVVTAAGRGMGEACARELAARGYRLAVMSLSDRAVSLARELEGVGLRGSVLDPAAIDELIDGTLERYGRIDAVVNNTGHPPKGELLDITDEEWHHGLDLIVLSVLRMLRRVTPPMLETGGGAIVNISTFAAFEPTGKFPVSSPLRAALGSVVKIYADRYAAEGIRINNVLPGFIDSIPSDEERIATIPMRRQGRVGEIAKTVAFLLSDDAGYITGQNLRADGGLTRSV